MLYFTATHASTQIFGPIFLRSITAEKHSIFRVLLLFSTFISCIICFHYFAYKLNVCRMSQPLPFGQQIAALNLNTIILDHSWFAHPYTAINVHLGVHCEWRHLAYTRRTHS